MGNKIAIRAYTEDFDKREKRFYKENRDSKDFKRILVFDTETDTDQSQSLKFGSFKIIQDKKEELKGIFYRAENIQSNELDIIKEYCKQSDLSLFESKQFIDEIFYSELIKTKTLCVGFNLPFDLSRLAIHFGEGRYAHKGSWFSVQLSYNKFLPRLKIKSIDSTMSFIQFAKDFTGYFLDLRTPSSIFKDDKGVTLEEAGKFFECEIIKKKSDEHGKISKEYLDYNLNDLEATYNLYEHVVNHFKKYQIEAPLTKVYSSASLGKSALRQMGIQPLSRINTKINAKVKGQLMSAYFGGRCEVKIRKSPIEVSVLDFSSMYPSLTINMGLWDFITAKDIQEKDVTRSTIEFLKRITLRDLTNKDIWKLMNVLVELKPDEDILPVRSNYHKDGEIYNVGINYFKHKKTLYYALPDVIASVLFTGKIPEIQKAIEFIPIGKQETLKKTKILGITIDPLQENFIKTLVEKRQEIKQLMKSFTEGTADYNRQDDIQKSLKILANSITYGIFIELRSEERYSDLAVYSSEQFFTKQKVEEEGKFFNPLIAVMQVSGARLLLAMAEKYMLEKDSSYAYMDTDSCYVPSAYAQELKNFFQPLNPYQHNQDFFKIDKEKYLFYGISAKRYVLYKLEGKKIIIEKDNFRLHGLGHLSNPFKKKLPSEDKWHKEIWEDIIKLHYNFITKQDIINKYSSLFAISKLAISTPFIYKRFNKYNKKKSFSRQIKPFNFFLVGQKNKNITPISPYSNNPQSIVHMPFIDYKSGKILKGVKHWKNLADTILDYAEHPESKFVNGNKTGKLERRHVNEGELIFIGKEVKSLEQIPLIIDKPTEYKSEESKISKILSITFKEARKMGVSKSTLWEMHDRLRKNPKKFNWTTKAVKKLLS